MAEFWSDYGLPFALIVAQSVTLLVALLLIVAFLLYADRKVWAAVQMRRGPNVVGPWGLLQSFADLLKFVFKEPIIPAGANKGIFLLAPLVTAGLALSAWAVMPVDQGWAVADINVCILFIFAISSLQVYGVIMAGWASNSKYAFLAALRSAAQMVSYEVSIGFVIITVLLIAVVLMCGLGTVLFLGGWLPLFPVPPFTWIPGVLWFILKVCFLFFLIAMVKAIVPRYRYDQLMRLGWEVFLPLSLAMVVIVAAVLHLWHGT